MSGSFFNKIKYNKPLNYEKKWFMLYTFASCAWLIMTVAWWAVVAATSSESLPNNMICAVLNTCIFAVYLILAIKYYYLRKATLQTGIIKN